MVRARSCATQPMHMARTILRTVQSACMQKEKKHTSVCTKSECTRACLRQTHCRHVCAFMRTEARSDIQKLVATCQYTSGKRQPAAWQSSNRVQRMERAGAKGRRFTTNPVGNPRAAITERPHARPLAAQSSQSGIPLRSGRRGARGKAHGSPGSASHRSTPCSPAETRNHACGVSGLGRRRRPCQGQEGRERSCRAPRGPGHRGAKRGGGSRAVCARAARPPGAGLSASPWAPPSSRRRPGRGSRPRRPPWPQSR